MRLRTLHTPLEGYPIKERVAYPNGGKSLFYEHGSMAVMDFEAVIAQMREAREKMGESKPFTPEEIRALARQAVDTLPGRLQYYAPLVGVSYGRVTFRCQKTKWGSCSSQGNLNFNCLLMLCPPEVLDYIVVHELCHRKELNHSPRFWAEVERVMPDYRKHRDWLKAYGNQLIARIPK